MGPGHPPSKRTLKRADARCEVLAPGDRTLQTCSPFTVSTWGIHWSTQGFTCTEKTHEMERRGEDGNGPASVQGDSARPRPSPAASGPAGGGRVGRRHEVGPTLAVWAIRSLLPPRPGREGAHGSLGRAVAPASTADRAQAWSLGAGVAGAWGAGQREQTSALLSYVPSGLAPAWGQWVPGVAEPLPSVPGISATLEPDSSER